MRVVGLMWRLPVTIFTCCSVRKQTTQQRFTLTPKGYGTCLEHVGWLVTVQLGRILPQLLPFFRWCSSYQHKKCSTIQSLLRQHLGSRGYPRTLPKVSFPSRCSCCRNSSEHLRRKASAVTEKGRVPRPSYDRSLRPHGSPAAGDVPFQRIAIVAPENGCAAYVDFTLSFARMAPPPY